MNVIIFGATGMVGSGVLQECIEEPVVRNILVIGRTSCNIENPKITEILHQNFYDFSDIQNRFKGYQACFFCLGVSSLGKSESEYARLTYDLTLAAASAIVKESADLTFCYVSGEGTDSSEKGSMMWARVKGKTENELMRLFKKNYMFRPGFIQPLKGVRSKTLLYRCFYILLGPLLPLFKRIVPNHITTSENVGKAMISVANHGYEKNILSNKDINLIALS